MPASVGHPATAMVPVHGGNFGNNTETSVGALLVDAFGEGVLEAIQEIATAKGKHIAAERAKAEKAEADRLAKEEAVAEKAEAKEEKEAAKAVAPHVKPHGHS